MAEAERGVTVVRPGVLFDTSRGTGDARRGGVFIGNGEARSFSTGQPLQSLRRPTRVAPLAVRADSVCWAPAILFSLVTPASSMQRGALGHVARLAEGRGRERERTAWSRAARVASAGRGFHSAPTRLGSSIRSCGSIWRWVRLLGFNGSNVFTRACVRACVPLPLPLRPRVSGPISRTRPLAFTYLLPLWWLEVFCICSVVSLLEHSLPARGPAE